MPLVDGKDILSAIRSLRHYAGIPVIVFSGSAAPTDKKEAEDLGAFYFMYKPSGIVELSTELKRLFTELEAELSSNSSLLYPHVQQSAKRF
jgi:DNA-binding response OmpR family regulator